MKKLLLTVLVFGAFFIAARPVLAGTINIEQYGSIGISNNDVAPIANLGSIKAADQDETTSIASESITLENGTTFVRIMTKEDHRVTVGVDNTDDSEAYALCYAYVLCEFGVKGAAILYYRLD